MGKKQERKGGTLQPRKVSIGGDSTTRSPALTSCRRERLSQVLRSGSQETEDGSDYPGETPPFSELLLTRDNLAVVLGPELLREDGSEPPSLPNEQADGKPVSSLEKDIEAEFEYFSNSGCCKSKNAKRWGYRNLLGLSFAYVSLFSAFIGLQNLQSTLNAEGGLGLASLTTLYSVFILSGFVTPGFVKLLGTKYSLLFGFISHLIYTLANFYPSWFTLIPSSVVIGFASGPLWAASSTHLAEVAVRIAPALGESQDLLISRFTGTFFFIFQFSQIPGNLASSLILFPYGEGDNAASNIGNSSHGNSSHGNSTELPFMEDCNALDSTSFDPMFLNLLVSAYASFIVVGIMILLVSVDRLQTDTQFLSGESKATPTVFIVSRARPPDFREMFKFAIEGLEAFDEPCS